MHGPTLPHRGQPVRFDIMAIFHRRLPALGLALLVAAVAGACGSSAGNRGFPTGRGDDGGNVDGFGGDGSGGHEGGLINGDGSTSDAAGVFDVEPATLQTITVTANQMTPTLLYKATLGGSPINAKWTVDRGDLGSIGAG